MKHHHPDVFCASLLNAQPMGFYAPAQIVADARKHGVEVRPVSINHSHWDCTLEYTNRRHLAVRLGFRQMRGMANLHGARIVAARGDQPYGSVEEVWRRAGVPRAAIERLAEADAFSAIAQDRRQSLWKVKGLGEAPLPLFAAADAKEEQFSPEGIEPIVTLGPLTEGREVVEDYRSIQLSLRAHPVSFLREELSGMKIVSCGDLPNQRDGRNLEVAGIVLVRQRPAAPRACSSSPSRTKPVSPMPSSGPTSSTPSATDHVGLDDRGAGASAEGGRDHPCHRRPDHQSRSHASLDRAAGFEPYPRARRWRCPWRRPRSSRPRFPKGARAGCACLPNRRKAGRYSAGSQP
jgi:hypothetical protein